MSEKVRELVDAMVKGSASEMEGAFADAMAEKLSGKIDDMRVNVAQNMFKDEAEVETTEAEVPSEEPEAQEVPDEAPEVEVQEQEPEVAEEQPEEETEQNDA